LIDINAEIDATILIVSHNINLARTVPDNLGMLFRRQLVMFGPREVLLTSEEPVVKQFLNGTMIGPIGMSEEKDDAQMAAEQAMVDAGHHAGGVDDVEGIVPQMKATPGMPFRQAVARRQERVREIMDTLPFSAQLAIQESFDNGRRCFSRLPGWYIENYCGASSSLTMGGPGKFLFEEDDGAGRVAAAPRPFTVRFVLPAIVDDYRILHTASIVGVMCDHIRQSTRGAANSG